MNTPEKLFALFRCADRLNAELWGSGVDPISMSPKQLAEHVEKICGVQITIEQVDVETDHIFGHIERYGDDGKKAIIYVVKNISDRFKHAVIVKEMCQILLDRQEDWRSDGEDTLQRLTMQILEPDLEENAAWRSEVLAERLSWELLYPIEIRRKDLADGVSPEHVAARVRLPVQIVLILLSKTYMEWCSRWWELLATQKNAGAKVIKAAG